MAETEVGKPEEVVVTPEMIEAGYAVLKRSGLTDDLLEADRLWVVEIFEAMTQAYHVV